MPAPPSEGSHHPRVSKRKANCGWRPPTLPNRRLLLSPAGPGRGQGQAVASGRGLSESSQRGRYRLPSSPSFHRRNSIVSRGELPSQRQREGGDGSPRGSVGTRCFSRRWHLRSDTRWGRPTRQRKVCQIRLARLEKLLIRDHSQ